MKNFKTYLAESKKQYDFRVKIAGTFTTEQETALKTLLDKFAVSTFKKSGTTPIQAVPLDFPQVKNCEVHIFETVLDYPTTSQELTAYLTDSLGIHPQNLVVRNPGEPSEQYQIPTEKRVGSLLTDNEYKEAPNANFEEYYGDTYNSGFVKELNQILKLQRKERGEEIPTESVATYNTDTAAGSQSVLKQATDPRK